MQIILIEILNLFKLVVSQGNLNDQEQSSLVNDLLTSWFTFTSIELSTSLSPESKLASEKVLNKIDTLNNQTNKDNSIVLLVESLIETYDPKIVKRSFKIGFDKVVPTLRNVMSKYPKASIVTLEKQINNINQMLS